jgi:hypothetical protein
MKDFKFFRGFKNIIWIRNGVPQGTHEFFQVNHCNDIRRIVSFIRNNPEMTSLHKVWLIGRIRQLDPNYNTDGLI